ncbi:Vimentin, putative, partial [Perkinsus marinus ATCC 50983]
MKHPTLIGEDSSDKFRVNEVKFLQEQHAAAVTALARIEQQRDEARATVRDYEQSQEAVEKEYESDMNNLRVLQEEEREQRVQLQQHDDNITEAALTNTNIKTMIKSEEEAIVNLKAEQKTSIAEEVRLEGIAEEFKRIKKLGEDQVVFTDNEAARVMEMLRQIVQEQDQIVAAMRNMEAQAKSEMDSVETALRAEKKRNTELLQQCRHNEVTERKMTQEIEDLKRLSDEERKELIRLEAMRDGSAYEQEQYVNEKGELMRRLESLKEQNKKSCLPCINHS